LSHALVVSKIGKVFENPSDYNSAQIKQAEDDLDSIVAELIPEIKDVKLAMGDLLKIIEQMMVSIEPSENKELKEQGVEVQSDPKV
jgi:hypothetical protein